jgi:ribonuclease HII
MDEFNLDLACSRYFEQKARNDKALADLKKLNKAAMDDLKEEIETGHRNAFAYALAECNDKDHAELLKEEIEKRLRE